MRCNLDDALMAKCKSLDFSVESANYDKNLEILKGKLADINEERCSMNGLKRVRKPFAILVAVIAIMAMSAATLAASPVLRNRAIRAVQHDCGAISVSVTVDAEYADSLGDHIRIGTEADGSLFVETKCGTHEILEVYSAADLCPDEMLLDDYVITDTPDTINGIEAFLSYTADLDDLMIDYFTSDGFGVIQIDAYTLFYRMMDDYGIVEGAAVVEASGAVYFAADCGARKFIFRP